MGYPNLRAEMARRDIRITDLMRVTGKSRAGVSKNINGIGKFSIDESLAIRNGLFPDCQIDYLFGSEPISVKTNQ